MDYGNKLYKLRKNRSFSQEEVAAKLGVSRQTISLWETNQASPSMDNLIAFARLFKASLGELIGLENVSIESDKHIEKFEYEVIYNETKNIIYRRDHLNINTKQDLILFNLSFFFYFMALSLMTQVFRLDLDIARVALIISFVFILIGSLIYPLHIYTAIKNKLIYQKEIKIDFFKDYLLYSCTHLQEERIDYKMIDYFIERKDYLIIYVIKGNRIYVPIQNTNRLIEFLFSRTEKRRRKKPFWQHI
ncbi:MAG: helix-turn-helix transcriptional regulator [Bacillota bacterium]